LTRISVILPFCLKVSGIDCAVLMGPVAATTTDTLPLLTCAVW